MARRSESFIDLHAEKIVIGVCALIMIGAGVYGLGGARFSVNDKSAGEICDAAGEAAEQTRQAVLNAKADPKKLTPEGTGGKDPVTQLAEWYGEHAKGLVQIAGVPAQLPRTQIFPTPYMPLGAAGGSTKRQLAQIVAPDVPVVTTGRSPFDVPVEKPDLSEYNGKPPTGGGKPAERIWVSVAAQIDLTRQDAHFISESYPDGSFLEVVKVHLQRKDLTDTRRGWEDVEVYLPFKLPARPVRPDGTIAMDKLDDFRQSIAAAADFIARTRLPIDASLLPQVPYLDESPKPASTKPEEAEQEATARLRKWMDRAKAALSGKRPFKEPDVDAAYILARAAAQTVGAKDKETNMARQLLTEIKAKLPKNRRTEFPDQNRSPDRLMPILANDLDAQAGHTYVYRIRYEVLNIYAGNPGELANADDALRLTLLSGWSPPSRPVEVESDTYFYLTKADRAKKEVTVTVFKKSRRETNRQEYRIHVGDPIGRKEVRGKKGNFTTGLICVDIDFDRVVDGQKDVSMIYVDPTDGRLRERLLSRDKKDKFFQRLLETRTAARP